MNPQWYFNRRRACDRMRDSANDAFFTAESLENLSEALVREGIQNSLDAAWRDVAGVRQVRVRIRFVPSTAPDVRGYLAGLFGSAVVRTHSVGGQDFQPDAWFGCRDVEECPVSPVTHAEFIETFVGTLGLTRGNAPGLSVVVPSVDERVNIADLRRGVVRSFF